MDITLQVALIGALCNAPNVKYTLLVVRLTYWIKSARLVT